MLLNTKNDAVVHVPSFYRHLVPVSPDEESPFPWMGREEMDTHNRDKALISYLACRLPRGKLVVQGNVGTFFAYQNDGADVQLDGECGWRACYGVSGGRVTINGTAGHETGEGACGGQIYVNGQIRSIGGLLH